MLPPKIDTWLQRKALPQRLLLSGSGDLWSPALSIADQLLSLTPGQAASGIISDIRLCPDDGASLKIGDTQNPDPISVRGLINWLNQKPVLSRRVMILQNLERTSRDAQQAWLKVLEEPPARAQFILTTTNHHRLPETILSRVTVLPIATPTLTEESAEAQKFLASHNVIEQFKLIEALEKTNKDEPSTITNFTQSLLSLARHNPDHQARLPQLFKAHSDIERNVNKKLVLEHLALALQKQ